MGARDQIKTPPKWPWQDSLQYRVLFAYDAIFLVTMVALVIWIGDAIYQADLEAGKHELEVAAFLAANAIEDPLSGYTEEFARYREREDHQGSEDEDSESRDDAPASAAMDGLLPRLQQVANRFAADTNAQVTIYDEQGAALADSHTPVQLPISQLRLAEPATAVKGGAVISPHSFSGRADELAIIAVAPIQQSDQILGFVEISKPVSSVTADASGVLLQMTLAALAALTAATLLAIWIGRRLVQPLRKLEEAAFAVAAGDLTQTVAVQGNDEVGALAKAFNHMLGKVRSMLEQQQAFVANASHELRTPLTNIKLRSEALRTLHNVDPELEARYLGDIEAEADRLTRLANELLDLARLEKEKERVEPEAVDVAPILRKVAGIMQLRAERAGISLHTVIAGGLPHMLVRPEDMEVITVNLLDNAVKYTQRGGEVKLEAMPTADGAAIRIQDSGPGIPHEDMPHIFERFYRVDKARSRHSRSSNGTGSGSGLGLAIVRELVEQNGGQIGVESTPGEGTVFVVSFPAVA